MAGNHHKRGTRASTSHSLEEVEVFVAVESAILRGGDPRVLMRSPARALAEDPAHRALDPRGAQRCRRAEQRRRAGAGVKLRVKPWTVKQALPFVRRVHRRLKRVQGGLWAVRVVDERDDVVGCAIVGHAARELMGDDVLAVLRVTVLEGYANACSMLYEIGRAHV